MDVGDTVWIKPGANIKSCATANLTRTFEIIAVFHRHVSCLIMDRSAAHRDQEWTEFRVLTEDGQDGWCWGGDLALVRE